jgi:uncharacterized protein (DUF2249 family)
MHTLHQLSRTKPGETLIITNERIPVFLFEKLKKLGYDYHYEQIDDSTVTITITKKDLLNASRVSIVHGRSGWV